MNNSLRIRLFAVIVATTFMAVWVNHSRAEAPVGQYMIENGTVLDVKSQLTWEQTPSPNKFTWDGAKNRCQNLALGGTGWRVPSMKELQTVVDETVYDPAIDLKAFPNTLLVEYWTSSMRTNLASTAWVVQFGTGFTNIDDISSLHPVRCVR